MNFDVISMKKRAKALMNEISPKPLMIGLIFEIFVVIYIIIYFIACLQKSELIILLILAVLELLFINI